MRKEAYKREDINAYLLGALSDAKAEHFDELSFTDDNFAAELSAAEKDLVDAYVIGNLKGNDLEKFQTYYLASPLRREKVEFAKSFQTFAEKSLARAAPAVIEEKTKSFWANLLTIPRLQWGMAMAVFLLMIIGGWIFWRSSSVDSELGKTQSNTNQIVQPVFNSNQNDNQQNSNLKIEKKDSNSNRGLTNQPQKTPQPKVLPPPIRPRNETELAQIPKKPKADGTGIGFGSPAKVFSFFLLPPLRGSNNLPTFSIPPNTNQVKVELQLESSDFERYQVVLRNPSNNQIVWSGIRKVTPKGKNKVLNLQISAEKLKPQIYSFEVSNYAPFGTSEIISNYSFRIVR